MFSPWKRPVFLSVHEEPVPTMAFFRSLWMASRALLALQPSNQSQLLPPNATSCEDDARDAWDLLHRVLPTFIIAICCGGLLGNLSVLSVFLLPRRRLSAAEIYLANLAASDLVFVLGLPFWAQNVWNHFHWPFGAALCRAVNGVIKANLFISIFLVVAISRDRYCALVHPVASRGRRGRRRAQVTCLLIWAAGALLSVPTFLLRAVKAVPDLNVSACVLLLPPHEAWHFARMVELNVLPEPGHLRLRGPALPDPGAGALSEAGPGEPGGHALVPEEKRPPTLLAELRWVWLPPDTTATWLRKPSSLGLRTPCFLLAQIVLRRGAPPGSQGCSPRALGVLSWETGTLQMQLNYGS